MKRKLKQAILVAVSITASTVLLSAGNIYGLSCLPSEYSQAPYDGIDSSRSIVALPSPCPPLTAEESVVPQDEPDDESRAEDGILIYAVDLSKTDGDGKPEALLANFSGLNADTAVISALETAALKCDGSPEVYIYHTHAAESYANGDTYEEGYTFLSEDNSENTVAIGDEFAAVLRAHGIGVIHDTYHYSCDGYSQAYKASRSAVIDALSRYDGIKIVIDIHRDSVASDGCERKTLAYVDGEPTAQVMLVCGSAYNTWQKNLANALALQSSFCELYPRLARPIYLSKGEYNQSLFSGALLLEVGAAGNCLEEAKTAARLAAEAFCAAFGK